MSEKEYYQLTISIGKALSPIEMPLKVKHARAAIIGTFHSQGGHSFWAVATRQPLQDNRITAWKFCHLLHKLLREGHNLCCQHSMRHRTLLTEMGKLWGHLQDGYGNCIKQYTKFLVTKIEFHERNPRFPAHLALKRGELEQIGGDDINFYFHMAVEMFDYLDDILVLQDIIFKSLTMFQVNSMTAAGQCRVAPLIPCIQDSSPLYDFLVRIMFKLHSQLPNDLLIGHRERFRHAFKQLKAFYEQSRNLQYFVSLITVPKLPENGPNFTSQVDFGEYQTPVVVMPEEPEPEEFPLVDNLVDIASGGPPVIEEKVQQSQPIVDLEKLLRERDDLILHLQTEIDRLGKMLKASAIESRNLQSQLQQQLATLNSEYSNVQEELTNTRLEKQELELRAQTAPTLEQKAIEEGERAKASEEKYQKLKTMYTQIRDEHVKLLRQHGEISKQLAGVTKTTADAVKEKEEIKSRLEELEQTKLKAEESLQQSSNKLKEEREELSLKVHQLEEECRKWTEKAEDLDANKSAEIAELKLICEKYETDFNQLRADVERMGNEKSSIEGELTALKDERDAIVTANKEKLELLTQSLTATESESKKAYEEVLTNKQELETKLNEFEDELKNFQSKCEQLEQEKEAETAALNEKCTTYETKIASLEEEFAKAKEDASKEVAIMSGANAELTSNLELAKSELSEKQATLLQNVEEHNSQINELKIKLEETENRYQKLDGNVERLRVEKLTIENELQDLLHQQLDMEERHKQFEAAIAVLEDRVKETEIRNEAAIKSLLESIIKSSEKLATRAISENELAGTAIGTPAYFLLVAEELQDNLTELAASHAQYINDNSAVEAFARKVISGGHLMASSHVQGISVCNTCSDIDSGEHIAEELNGWCKDVQELFEALAKPQDADEVGQKINKLKSKLQSITDKVGDLSKKLNPTENIADMFESELASMDKAIEEAANKIEHLLSESRASDSGVKLEVNEKILDACTTLMKAIRVLVQKSRTLQAEIVGLGKGTNTAKEFYKRNHQWTEGLISAAKSVAQGANFLVTAANKAVLGDSKHQLDLVVAAQEIAASTAQLVVASRVKAPRDSTKLAELAKASKNVTQSTGAVVATAKDCSRQLEENQDMDLDKLTVHQAKTMEMEIQVKVLELEQALQVERMRLASFRRKNYQDK